MKWSRPIIYGAFATSFLALSVYFLVSGFSRPGFNSRVLFIVSAVMTLVMAWVTLLALRAGNAGSVQEEDAQRQGSLIGRYIKVLFASYGVAVGGSILLIVAGLFIFGFETVDHFLLNNMGLMLAGITVIALPVVGKYLR